MKICAFPSLNPRNSPHLTGTAIKLNFSGVHSPLNLDFQAPPCPAILTLSLSQGP